LSGCQIEAEAAYGIRHVALRYFNAAGADPDRKLGNFHQPETHLIPHVIVVGKEKARAKASAYMCRHSRPDDFSDMETPQRDR
jgi:UDP-arabinose 4-epimerase